VAVAGDDEKSRGRKARQLTQREGRRPELIIGGGKTLNYTALLLFHVGMITSGVEVSYSQIGGRWMLPTALALLLMFTEVDPRRGQEG
jgi:hypothetical protein